MKLSILILTHNRPKLFKRCIKSVIKNLPDFDIEILVNNDSNDIEEVYRAQGEIRMLRSMLRLRDDING